MTSLSRRLEAARQAAQSVGEAILSLRKEVSRKEAAGGQLKTPVDQAAEGWVLGYLNYYFPKDRYLCEELFESEQKTWDAPSAFWTVDALDGTRSFVDGYDGFCVQVAYIEAGVVRVGVVVEPVRRVTYWAVEGKGAFRQKQGGKPVLLKSAKREWPSQPVFVDSKEPQGQVGRFKKSQRGHFLECGSIGLKICRVAEGQADVFAKDLTFKLWDTAPGEVILQEAGGRMGLWSGDAIPYDGRKVYFNKIAAAPAMFFNRVIKNLEGTGVNR